MPRFRLRPMLVLPVLLACGGDPAPAPPDVSLETIVSPDQTVPDALDVTADAVLDVTVDSNDGIADVAPDSVDVADETETQVSPPLGPIEFDPGAMPPVQLSELNLFSWDGAEIQYNEGVISYALNTPLFSDYSVKKRAIWIPDGTQIQYQPNQVFSFPVGTVIIKSFLFPTDLRTPNEDLRLIETRLLMKSETGWNAWPYLWNEEENDAQRWVAGSVETIEIIDLNGDELSFSYLVPQRNQCKDCHDRQDENGDSIMVTIGPKARNINRLFDYPGGNQNQLEHLEDLGMLAGLPAPEDRPTAFSFDTFQELPLNSMIDVEIKQAARDYLDVNCAHCHSPTAVEGNSSQLWLNHDNEDVFHLGVCKIPGSAGKGGIDRKYDIVPGDPDASILIYRTETIEIGSMMPDIGRSLTHHQGIALLRAWVSAMTYEPCSE